jgi:hypothetical protein
MKGSRSWNRREFDVTANGYFTILKPSGWFPTVRLPGGFRYRFGQPKGPAAPLVGSPSMPRPLALDPATSRQVLSQLQILPPDTGDRSIMRPVLIALAATLATLLVLFWLWWIGHPE